MTLDWVESKPKFDWHSWRQKGLGSSDAPVLLELSPWRTLTDLWLEKTGKLEEEKKFKGNWATRRGNELEPEVREKYNKLTGCHMQVEYGESAENPLWRASFDGIDHSARRVIEIKCPGKVDHETAMHGKVPTKYMPQVQWLLMVSGYEYLDYLSYDGENMVMVQVKRDEAMINNLKLAAEWFWSFVVAGELPNYVAEQAKEIEVENDELLDLVREMDSKRLMVTELNNKIDALKEEIKKLIPSSKIRCGDFKISMVEKRGAIDYKLVEELKGVDLEKYRRPPYKMLIVSKNSEKA